MALAAGLVGLITGTTLLLVGLLLPDSTSHAIAVPRTGVSRGANARLDTIHAAPEGTRHRHLHFTATPPPDTSTDSELATARDPSHVVQPEPRVVGADLGHEVRRPRNCAGTNTDSAGLPTLPVCQDPREALVQMASQNRGPWTRWDGTGAATQAALAVPAPESAPAAAETVLLVEPIGPPPGARTRIYSRIALRPHAQWEVDLYPGELTLFVQHGRVGLVLEGGSAHVEVQDLLLGKRIDPVPPGGRVVLWPGDRLVVSRGAHLRVDNDDATLAIISVSRLQ